VQQQVQPKEDSKQQTQPKQTQPKEDSKQQVQSKEQE
jgi:hypothetical protein